MGFQKLQKERQCEETTNPI